MEITLIWSQPIQLRSGAKENFIYTFDIDDLPRNSGIYVFGRRKGKAIVPIYIGQSLNLWKRIKKQRNNVKLMMALKNSPGRKKFVTYAELIGRPGQVVTKALDIAEHSLIEHALADGHEIVNVQGAKRRKHYIFSTGGRLGRGWAPKLLAVEKKK